jgi:hypothetical protein
MRKHKFLTSAILTGAICLLTVLAFTTEKAEAWAWYGFSELCGECTANGVVGEKITFDFDIRVESQCWNTKTENFDQPGVGNFGVTAEAETISVYPDRDQGAIYVEICIPLDEYGDHSLHEAYRDVNGVFPPEHICHPHPNVNKAEWFATCPPDGVYADEIECTPGEPLYSVWVPYFTVDWVWYKKNGVRNSGTDYCEWNGDFYGGIPEHGVQFDCTGEILKKLNCDFKTKK